MTITLSGSYGQTQFRRSGLATDTTIDAYNASWIVDHSILDGDAANPYPFLIASSPSINILGATFNGEVSLTEDWEEIYYPSSGNGNSAAIRVESSPDAWIKDVKMTAVFDGIRIANGTQNFLIEDVRITDARDDAIENDVGMSGTIRDSLFDGVFVGIALDGSRDASNDTVLLDGVLMRMESYLYSRAGDGEVTHGSPFKTDNDDPENTPNIQIVNSVIAIERVDHESLERLQVAWDNVTLSQNNYYLNLSDTPLPSNYPC